MSTASIITSMAGNIAEAYRAVIDRGGGGITGK